MPDVPTTLRIPQYASTPGGGLRGQLYYNTTDNLVYYNTGLGWTSLASASGVGNVISSGTPSAGQLASWTDATHIQGVANNSANWDTAFTNNLRWDGGATSLVAATGRRSLGIGDGAIFTNASAASGQTGFAADQYLAGSLITIPTAGGWAAGSQYRCAFDMSKTAAGVATWAVTIRVGTLGTVSDPSVLSLAGPAAQTAAVDSGWFEVMVTFRAIGATAVVVGAVRLTRLTTTAAGFFASAVQVFPGVGTVSGSFNASAATKIGVAFNGGASFSGTCQQVQAEYKQ
jgi:hypothetical protein